jgi:hypothetical protein
MRILVTPTDSASGLVDYLRRCACDARIVRTNIVEASPRSAPDLRHSRVELDAFLRVWRAMHPLAAAEIVDQQPVEGRGLTSSAGENLR